MYLSNFGKSNIVFFLFLFQVKEINLDISLIAADILQLLARYFLLSRID